MNDKRKRVVVFGAGGHSRSVCDILLQTPGVQVVGLLDNKATTGFYGIPLLGGDERLKEIIKTEQINFFFAAIGSNSIRKRLTEKALDMGLELVNAISKHAIISPNVVLQNGLAIMAGAVINAGATIGQGSILNTNCSVDHDTTVGQFCHIAPGCAVCGCVKIGNQTFLGVGSSVIDGVNICDSVIVGAGAVVLRNITGPCTVVGVPAKNIVNNIV